MPLVAPGCIRYTLNGTFQGTQTWANIWDVDLLADINQDRAPLIQEYAELIIENWVGSIGLSLTEDTVLTSVSWVDLDDLNGSVGEVSGYSGGTPPYNGSQTTAPNAANVSVLVTKGGTPVRGTRNGRMFIVGYPEANTNGTSLESTAQSVFQDRCTAFLNDMTDPPAVELGSMQPVVVHTRNQGTPSNPDIVYNGKSNVTSLQVQNLLATQRRRLRR